MIAYPRIVAHRCGGILAPENTLAGLEAAAALGCCGVEFDVMLTADQVPILMHDETLDRTTACKGCVADMTFTEIRTIAPLVPSLAEAIDACQRLGLWTNVELKPSAGHEAETGSVVGAWLARHWNRHGVVSSFSRSSLEAARRYLPQVTCALLFEDLPEDWSRQCAQGGIENVHLAREFMNQQVAHSLEGRTWACYTVNTLQEARRLFDWGCSAVFTDRPDLLRFAGSRE